MMLSQYDFDIKYVPARKVAPADCLSRYPLTENEGIEIEPCDENPLSDINKYSYLAAIDVDSMTPDNLIKGQKEFTSKRRKVRVYQMCPIDRQQTVSRGDQ
jgi:hypothetical protein